MSKKVEAWQTSDGQLFKKRNDADQHERLQKSKLALREALASHLDDKDNKNGPWSAEELEPELVCELLALVPLLVAPAHIENLLSAGLTEARMNVNLIPDGDSQ